MGKTNSLFQIIMFWVLLFGFELLNDYENSSLKNVYHKMSKPLVTILILLFNMRTRGCCAVGLNRNISHSKLHLDCQQKVKGKMSSCRFLPPFKNKKKIIILKLQLSKKEGGGVKKKETVNYVMWCFYQLSK